MSKILPFKRVIEAVKAEREYQDYKWGSLEEKNQTVEGYLLILKSEVDEAIQGWMKNKEGRDSVLSEITQVAAVAVACLQQHGCEHD